MRKILLKIKSEEGSMLILTIISITIIIILGVSALNVATTEANITINEQDRIIALNAAESGIAHAISDKTKITAGTIWQVEQDLSSQGKYLVTKALKGSPYEYEIISKGVINEGEINEVKKTITTNMSVIPSLAEIKGPIIGDNINLSKENGGNTNEDISVSTSGSEPAQIIANTGLSISDHSSNPNNSHNAQFNNINFNIKSDANENIASDYNITPGRYSTYVPVPQIDIQYYKSKISSSNINSITVVNNWNEIYSDTVDSYKVYYFSGDVTIRKENTNEYAIIIAEGNVTIDANLGSSLNPLIVYGKNVTLEESGQGNQFIGVMIAGNDIVVKKRASVTGSLIAPNVNVSGIKWSICFDKNMLSDTIFSTVKLSSNKFVKEWVEN